MAVKINVEQEPKAAVQRLDRVFHLRVQEHPVAQASEALKIHWALSCLGC